MCDQDVIPQAFPVREREGQGWEVLIAAENMWLACENECDARVISSAPVLEYQCFDGRRSGNAFASELELLARMLAKYNIGFCSRFIARRAEEVRNASGRSI